MFPQEIFPVASVFLFRGDVPGQFHHMLPEPPVAAHALHQDMVAVQNRGMGAIAQQRLPRTNHAGGLKCRVHAMPTTPKALNTIAQRALTEDWSALGYSDRRPSD